MCFSEKIQQMQLF